ncbi:MAG: hypothetical protein ACFCUT_06730 [Kiloniellaceae bacterium]
MTNLPDLHRRHLDEGQRAMIAARLVNVRHGGDRKSDQAANLPVDAVTTPCAAAMLNVGERREDGVTHEQWIGLCPLHRSRAA